MRDPLALALCLAAAAAPGAVNAAVPGVNSTMAFSTNSTWPYSHNSGWALLPSGRIAVVFQASESVEGAASQVILLAASDDGGATFAPARVIAGGGRASAWGPAAFADGAVLRVFYAQAPLARPKQLCGDIMHTSSADGGRTWSSPELALAQAAWGGGSKCSDNKPAQVGARQWALPFMSVAAGGATTGLLAAAPGAGMAGPWAPLAGSIPTPPHYNTTDYLSEPAIARCGGGGGSAPNALLALLRNYERTWAARSADGGASWDAAAPTALTNPYSKVDLAVWPGGAGASGPPPGALLLAHNPVRNCTQPVYCPRTPLGVSWSPDCGATWSPPLLLEPTDVSPHGASYPTVGACGRGRVCASYTLYREGGFAGIRFAAFDVDALPPLAG